MLGATILQKGSLRSLGQSSKSRLIVLSKDQESIEADSQFNQLCTLKQKGVVECANVAWFVDSLCYYEIQETSDKAYALII